MKTQFSELEKLNRFVGKWRSEGEVVATSTSPSIQIKGTDIYEWVCEGHFMLHRVDVFIGEHKVEVIEMIGYDDAVKNYPMRSFDNQGNFTIMYLSQVENSVWKISGNLMRSHVTIDKDGNGMNAHWERAEDGSNWVTWMEMNFTKVYHAGLSD